MLSEARQKNCNSKEIAINCSINNNFSHQYKKKHILMKKGTKNTFQGKKKHHSQKKHKKHFCFLKTLAGRTVNIFATRIYDPFIVTTKLLYFINIFAIPYPITFL